MRQIRFRSQNGAFLIGALVLVAIVGVAVIAVATLVVTQNQAQQTFINERKAFYAAETGIEYAQAVLADSVNWRDGASNEPIGDSKYSINVEDKVADPTLVDTLRVTSIGTLGNIQKPIQVFLQKFTSTWPYGVTAGKKVYFNSGTSSSNTINGDIHANEEVLLDPTKYTVNGTVTTAPPTVDLPIIDWNLFKDAAIAAGQYVVGDKIFSPSGSPYTGTWYVTGEARLQNNAVVDGGAIVSESNIWIEGNNLLLLISATGDLPALLAMNDIIIEKNNTDVAGFIYAGHDLNVKKNNCTVTGGVVVGNNITCAGSNFNVTYDSTFTTLLPGVDFGDADVDSLIFMRWQN